MNGRNTIAPIAIKVGKAPAGGWTSTMTCGDSAHSIWTQTLAGQDLDRIKAHAGGFWGNHGRGEDNGNLAAQVEVERNLAAQVERVSETLTRSEARTLELLEAVEGAQFDADATALAIADQAGRSKSWAASNLKAAEQAGLVDWEWRRIEVPFADVPPQRARVWWMTDTGEDELAALRAREREENDR